MPQIGWLEILIIVSIAIIIVGPKDFPIMLKKVGSWIGSIKRYVSNDFMLPNTEELSKNVISLPIHTELENSNQDYIIEQVINFYK